MSKNKLILLHIMFWVVIYLKAAFVELTPAGLIVISQPSSGWKLYHLITLSYFLVPMVTFYSCSFFLRYILTKKFNWPAILLYVIIILIVPIVARAFIEFGILKPFAGFDNYKGNRNFSISFFIFNTLFYYWDIFLLGIAYSVFINWRTIEKQKQEQAAMHKAAELDFLKSQLNPHFLFNSLNDIYALVIKKSDTATEAITQLSDLLRYALYESTLPEVSLEKEITYINNYLSLQKTGYEGKFYFLFTTTGDTKRKMIAPLLLLPFVENACKHGITNKEDVPIEINLQVSEQELLFKINNRTKNMQKDKMGGIGLENVRKRLLLLYPGTHLLTIGEQENRFNVILKIDRE